MSWERAFAELFDDLEGQAQELLGRDRDWEVAEQARAEYASVPLLARLMASVGREIELRVQGAERIAGRLARCTESWMLVERAEREWVVPHRGVLTVAGVSDRALPREAWPSTARLGLGSALRMLADGGHPATVRLVDGALVEGAWARLGHDFAEVVPRHGDQPVLVAHHAIAALVRRPDPMS